MGVVGEWLKGRRNALIDAFLVYAVAEWVMPVIVSTVLYLGSSDGGIAVLFTVGYLPLIGAGVVFVTREASALEGLEDDGKYKYVYVWERAQPPFLGGHSRRIRVRVNPRVVPD